MAVEHENKCLFVGTIKANRKFTEGYELKYTTSGTALLTINLCVSEGSRTSDGEQRFRSTYIPLNAWGDLAERFANQITLNDTVKVWANYRTRSYTTADGGKMYGHNFNVFSLEVLEHGSATEADEPEPARSPAPARRSSSPAPRREARPPEPDVSTGEGEDDDIPF